MKRSHFWFSALAFITHGDNLRKDLSQREKDDPSLPGGGTGGVRVIFGVQTSAIPRYEEKLKEGFATWIDGVPREDRIIVGPRCNENNCKQRFWEPTACEDTSNLCKHLTILERAHSKDFDWLVTLEEDHLVMADALRTPLAYLDPSTPMIIGNIGEGPDGGCGQLWRFHKGSNNGTLPMPPEWVEPDKQTQAPCPAIQMHGGLCGGMGILYSRAAVERLFASGRDAFWSRMENLMQANLDSAISCVARGLGIRMTRGCGLMDLFSDFFVATEKPIDSKLSLIYHVTGGEGVPEAMRGLWEHVKGKKAQLLDKGMRWVPLCMQRCSHDGFCRDPQQQARAELQRMRSPSEISAFRELDSVSVPLPQAHCSRSSRKDDIRRFYELATEVNSTGVRDTIMNKMDDHPFTDKVTGHHYELMYGMFLLPLQNAPSPPKILEIGLGCGYPWGTGVSQRLWRSMFPESEVWGAELDAQCVEKSKTAEENKGIRFLQGDQADFKTLDRWVEETGGGDFDVIIDDGGHSNLMIMHSFEKLFPKMKLGGLYFMEDLQVGRSADTPGLIFDDTKGKAVVIDILKDWMEQLVVSKDYRKPTVHPIPQGVAFVFCQSEACVIGKDVGIVRPSGVPSL